MSNRVDLFDDRLAALIRVVLAQWMSFEGIVKEDPA
jgi:hypothetical protein